MNIAKMIKQAQDAQQQIQDLQMRLADVETVGSSGGGMVQVTLTGRAECRRIKINPALVTPNDVGILEDLIVAAYNDAKGRVEKQLADEMTKITSGMQLPPGFKLPF